MGETDRERKEKTFRFSVTQFIYNLQPICWPIN